ncbi:hypothetical protein MICRO116_160013 [Micrococcus sp. 116]|nr:hypothetical protein MICRO116_160013 [Micrococcus sp. 116]
MWRSWWAACLRRWPRWPAGWLGADDLLGGVTLPAVRHDLTSLPARDRGQQDDSHNDWTYETGSAHWAIWHR